MSTLGPCARVLHYKSCLCIALFFCYVQNDRVQISAAREEQQIRHVCLTEAGEMFSLSHSLGITALMLINRQNVDVIHWKKIFSKVFQCKSSTEACFHCGIKNKISAFFLTILTFFSQFHVCFTVQTFLLRIVTFYLTILNKVIIVRYKLTIAS